jgi:glutamate racemase
LVAEFCPGKIVTGWAASDIVTLVEDDYLNPDAAARARILSAWAQTIREQGGDTVVLGCTHFLYVTEELTGLLGPDVKLLDSRGGVGRRVLSLLNESGSRCERPSGPSVLHFTSGAWSDAELAEHERKYRYFAQRFGLDYGGPWSEHP